MQKFYLILVFSLLNALILTCEAGLIINIRQVNSDFVATGSGTVNMTELTASGGTGGGGALYPSYGTVVLGDPTIIALMHMG